MPNVSFSSLLQTSCQLTYTAGDTGYYGVAIQIEDFLTQSDTEPMSSVPLQFLIFSNDTGSGCTAIPTFSSETISDGTMLSIQSETLFITRIIAESSSSM